MSKVYKKTSGNGSLSLFLGRRDFVDHVTSVDPVDGVVKVDPTDLGDRKVWVHLVCAFRYGRDDLDVIGLSYRKDIWIEQQQIYPPTGSKTPNTPMQDILLKKAGDQSYPFIFSIPTNLPCSVTLQPGPDDKGKPCGIDFEVKTYIAKEADNPDEQVDKKDTARLLIRKIQFAPNKTGAGPKASLSKQFMMSDKLVHVDAYMEKEICYHGEPIPIRIKINNETNKVVKKIKVTVDQTTDVVLFSADKYTKNVLNEEFEEMVEASSTYDKTLNITPMLAHNKDKRGLALDGKLKEEDTNLASTTMLRPGMEKEVMGILVFYKIKIVLMVSRGGILGDLVASDVAVELPLVLMHPKPAELLRSTSFYHLSSLLSHEKR
ncbi:arrestin-C-like isoform X1 [Brienomyrus brachyistius]|uniref:arrestin-C-like isoform X1 n=1 Tax=Brienomyrus brachyistius TaxID=42636 RepID=UPI0020B302AC|nr:arrestin-C-like isoform X1 [Brienomyrus brachyistius]